MLYVVQLWFIAFEWVRFWIRGKQGRINTNLFCNSAELLCSDWDYRSSSNEYSTGAFLITWVVSVSKWVKKKWNWSYLSDLYYKDLHVIIQHFIIFFAELIVEDCICKAHYMVQYWGKLQSPLINSAHFCWGFFPSKIDCIPWNVVLMKLARESDVVES